MAYSGYRLKINNNEFPNTYISKGSYTSQRGKRVCKEWTDLTGITHKTYYPTTKTTITFSIREHLPEEHAAIILFLSISPVTIQYWDDDTETYLEGTFDIEPIAWKHLTTRASGGFYDTTQITLTEQ